MTLKAHCPANTNAREHSRLYLQTHTHSTTWGQTSQHTHKYTQTRECRDCKAKGNGQFVKSGESGEADMAVGLETMAEIKASLAEGGL